MSTTSSLLRTIKLYRLLNKEYRNITIIDTYLTNVIGSYTIVNKYDKIFFYKKDVICMILFDDKLYTDRNDRMKIQKYLDVRWDDSLNIKDIYAIIKYYITYLYKIDVINSSVTENHNIHLEYMDLTNEFN